MNLTRILGIIKKRWNNPFGNLFTNYFECRQKLFAGVVSFLLGNCTARCRTWTATRRTCMASISNILATASALPESGWSPWVGNCMRSVVSWDGDAASWLSWPALDGSNRAYIASSSPWKMGNGEIQHFVCLHCQTRHWDPYQCYIWNE